MSVGARGDHEPSLFSDAAVSTLGSLGGTGISGISSILIARGLGVTARGRWAVISSLAVVVATIAATGLPTAAAYAAARLDAGDRQRLVQSALTGAVALGIFAAIAYLAAAAVIRPPVATVAVLVACAIPLAVVWYSVAHQLTLTVASMRWFAAAQVVSAMATLSAVVILYASGALTVLAVTVVSASSTFIGAGVCLVGLRRARNQRASIFTAPVAAIRVLRPYLAYAMVTFATLSLTQIVQRIDVLLVNGYKGPHSAGLYSVAVQITDLMLVVPAALGLVIFRRSARSTATHHPDALLALRWTGIFGVAAALFAAAIAAWVIPIVFGSGYRGSVEPLRLLLPGTIAFSMQSVLSQYLAGRGRPRIVLVAWLVGAIVGIGADLIVIPAYGITGAAIVSSASYVIVTGLHFHALRGLRVSAGALA
ncbi:MAG: oligosaccharide flippase family protein [Solirubrobacteraceae bacterium]